MTKEKIKRIENILKDHKHIDLKAKNIDINIAILNNKVSIRTTNAFHSTVKNDVINSEEDDLEGKINILKSKKANLLMLKDQVNNALKCLSDVEKKLIELRYFSAEKLTWASVAMTLGYDEGYCRKLRRKIIEQLINYIPNV